jgi:hypothetical protein
MKHPVLRVKKGTTTYDDREDRIVAERAAEVREQRRARKEKKHGVLRLLRIRRGSLLPILILVLIALVILRSLPRSASRANINGWHAVLQARIFEDTLRVGVGFSQLGPRGPGSLASVLFVLPDTGAQVGAEGVLQEPRAALRARMHYTGREKTLRAIVTIDGQSRTLSLSLPGP